LVRETACLEALGGHGGWPVRNVARLTRSFAPSAPDDVEALASAGIPADGILAGLWEAAEELAVTVALSGELYQSRSYHVRAADPGVRQLVIVHHGHGDDFAPGGYRLVETAAELLGAGRSALFM
jgi:hypothetical protein